MKKAIKGKEKKVVSILLANFDVEVISDLVFFLPEEFGRDTRIIIIENTNREQIKDYKSFDYFIIEPGRCGIVDEKLLNGIIANKKQKAQIIVYTVSDNAGQTTDSVFKNLGIEKIIRLPSNWKKIKEVLLR